MRGSLTTVAFLLLLAGEALGSVEVCGNDTDDDGDGIADNNCFSTQATGVCENPLGCGTTGMVSWSTGALSYALPPDVSFKSTFGPQVLRFSRFYTSQYTPGSTPTTVNHKPLGERWQHSFLTFLHKSGTTAILHTAEGRDVLFTYQKTIGGYDEYTAQVGYHVLHFRQSTSTSKWDLQTLTGETLIYNSSGQLIEVWDNLVSPNKAYVTWDSTTGGNVSTVTDANGTDRLKFNYTGGLLISIELQHYNGTSWSTTHTTTYSYTGGVLMSTTIGAQLSQQYSYTSGYMTQIQDGSGNRIAGFAYSSTSAGQVDRIDTSRGTVGFDFNSSRTSCSGKSVLYFSKGNTTSCSVDTDCGAGFLCGGKTGAGSTGTCFLAARCLTLTTSSVGSESLISTVTPIGPGGGSCSGACTDVAQYVWGTSINSLDAIGVQDPVTSKYVSKTYNSDGLPTKIAYSDSDTDPSNSGYSRIEYLKYDTTFPGRVKEIRRQSDLNTTTCTDSDIDTSGCVRTIYTYQTTDNRLSQITQSGTTYNSSGVNMAYSYATSLIYTTQGELAEVDGPVTNMKIVYHHDSSAPYTLLDVKRYYDATHYVQRSFADYDIFNNRTTVTEEDGTLTCLTYDSSRNVLSQRRHAMAGQTTCSTANSLDLTTSWTRDSALRLTQLQRPDQSCMLYQYDSVGRLSTTKRRDDCSTSSSGDYETFTYGADGLLTETDTYDASATLTHKQPFVYFASRRLQQIVNPVDTSKFTGLVYDARGLLSEIDGGGNLTKTTFGLDDDGRVTTLNKYTTSSSYDTWSFGYTWEGEQSLYDDGDSRTTSKRDDLGRLVKLESPDASMAILRVYDAGGRVTTLIDAGGTHSFTYDALRRPLVADFAGTCDTWNNPDATRTYDAPPTGTCPIGGGSGCTNTNGRLAYVKVKLMCDTSYSDHTLDQETWFAYDAAGRVIDEYVKDDAGRIAEHVYEWSKNGVLTKTTTPSGAVIGATLGSSGSNSDTDKITALWRTNASTPIIDNILWFPYGGLQQYNQFNTVSGTPLLTRITRNLAYRVSSVAMMRLPSDNFGYVGIAEDADGRVTIRDYYPSDPQIPGRYDSYYSYDQQSHLVCETTNFVSSCPTSGSNIKNSHSASPPFTHAGDWKTLLRPIAGSTGGLTHTFTDAKGTHQISSINQSDGTPSLGTTSFSYNSRGSRASDDNTSGLTHDGRTYTYDGRGNVSNVRGEYWTGSAWHYYQVASAFDGKNRRVFKSFYDESTTKLATWFFYYDALNRLVEVRYTPDTSASSTYSLFQLFWLEDRLVLYWQTDYPSANTSKRYVGTDETGRPTDLWTWATGNSSRVWTVNADAWGYDKVLVGPTVYQPILFAGQYKDDETVALMDDHTTVHRPGVVLNGFRTYDPFVGGYLQLDPMVDSTRSSYIYVDDDPVAKSDPDGLMIGLGIHVSFDERSPGFDTVGPDLGGFDDCADVPESVEGMTCGWGGGGGGPTVGPLPPALQPGTIDNMSAVCFNPLVNQCEPPSSLSARCPQWRCAAYYCSVSRRAVLGVDHCDASALGASNDSRDLFKATGCAAYMRSATGCDLIPPDTGVTLRWSVPSDQGP